MKAGSVVWCGASVKEKTAAERDKSVGTGAIWVIYATEKRGGCALLSSHVSHSSLSSN